MNMKQYETFELRFGGEVLPDAWAQIDLTATFSCAQESLTVKGFYDGESDGRGVYVVRFLPQYAGVYRYQVRGAVTAEGEIVCEASSPEAHGIVRAVGTHFAFADGAAVVGSVPGLLKAQAEDGQEVPAYPYPYVELDPAYVEKLAYEGYFENGCCFGVAKAILVALREKVGYPYTVIPEEMFANGKEGYTCGTLCGALGGAVAMIGLVCASADSRQLTKDLFAWYCSTNLPIYQPEAAAPVQTVAPSVNCIDSITKFMTAANVERGDIIRKRRCGGLSGDVARRTVELLNAHFGFAELPVASPVAEEETLAPNEYIGEAESFGGTLRVKVTMDGDKIAKIDILSHSDTAGVCNPAYDTVPGKIIDAQSTNVDAATNATISSKAIMAAVEDALSKVVK